VSHLYRRDVPVLVLFTMATFMHTLATE